MSESAEGADGEPSVRFYRPSAALTGLVTSYYMVDVGEPMSDHIHPEWGNIRLVVSGVWTSRRIGGDIDSPGPATLYGPSDVSRRVDSDGGALVGVGLTPLGWLKLVGRDASLLANEVVRLDGLLGVDDAVLMARLAQADDGVRVAQLDALLEGIRRDRGEDEPIVKRLHAALIANQAPDVAALAVQVGVSQRTLQRLALAAFGFGPKRLLRRQRFMRTLNNITEGADQPLGALLDDGYHDQAQFIREFRDYMGMTPSAYFRLPRKLLSRSAQERRRVIGEHFQLLHPPTQAG